MNTAMAECIICQRLSKMLFRLNHTKLLQFKAHFDSGLNYQELLQASEHKSENVKMHLILWHCFG